MGSQKDRESGNKSSFSRLLSTVAIRDASYIFQLILVRANILAYFSFSEKNSPIKRLCPFNEICKTHSKLNGKSTTASK